MDETQSPGRSPRGLFLIILNYALVYLVWGGTYLAIRVAVETIPPFHVVGLRFLFGGILFWLVALIGKRVTRPPSPKEIGASMLLGTFLLIGGNGLVTVAEQKVDSYLAALVLASTPMAVAFYDRILIGKKIDLITLGGILTGVAGVCVLLYNGTSLSMSFSGDVMLLIAGFMSWSFATSLGHRIRVFPDVFVNSGIQMLFVGIVCLSIPVSAPPFSPVHIASYSGNSIYGLLYLAIFGSAAFVAYNYLIQHEPAIRVVSYALVNPVIALFLGLVLAGEKATPYLLPGVLMIFSGLLAMLYGNKILKKKASPVKPPHAASQPLASTDMLQ